MIFPPEIINDTTESLFVRRSVRSRVIYAVVVAVVVAVGAALPFVYVQISMQARGIVRTPMENNLIQSAVYGEVTLVNMSENKAVSRGDTLLMLNAGEIVEQIRWNNQKINEYQTFITDVNALLHGETQLSTPKYRMEWQYCVTAIIEQQTRVDYLESEYRTAETLYRKAVTPQMEYLQQKNAYEAAVGQLNNLREQFRNRWESERTGYELDILEWQSFIRQLEEEKAKYILKAPETGSIIRFAGIQVGNFISPGQTIGYISGDSLLLVECYVAPSDIGYIRENQSVSFQIDAFDYNQWGLAYGKVKEISTDVVMNNNQPVFQVRCSLDTSVLTLKNGYQGILKKGMMLTGCFYLTDRSLWQLLFDKIDDWMNPKKKRDAKS